MKKISVIMLPIFVILTFIGCNAKDGYQERAKEFLYQYYGQYQQKDEIEKIFKFGHIQEINQEDQGPLISSHSFENRINEFIDEHFNGMLTEKAKEIFISNRLLPKADVLNTDIKRATIQNIEFVERENHSEGNLSFRANIEFQHEEGNVTNISQDGLIRIVKEDGVLKIDSFNNKDINKISNNNT